MRHVLVGFDATSPGGRLCCLCGDIEPVAGIEKAMKIPDFVTHYHLADTAPFQSLSTLDEPQLDRVLTDLDRRRTTGSRRVFGPKYMALRRLTERRLHGLFLAAGGTPELQAPHYFCLGACAWFRGLSPDMREVVVPLSALPDDVASFTYPDSVVSMGFGPEFGLPEVPRSYHGRVFRMSELPEVVREFGLPAYDPTAEYEDYWRRPLEAFIEVQVWSDAPLVPYRLQGASQPQGR